MRDHVVDGPRHAGVLPEIGAGRGALHDAPGAEKRGLGAQLRVLRDLVQRRHREVAAALEVEMHARERGARVRADELVVVDPDDAQVGRHVDAGLVRGVDRLLRDLVVGGQEPAGLGQRGQPRGQLQAVVKDRAGRARPARRLDEGPLALVAPERLAGVSDEGVVTWRGVRELPEGEPDGRGRVVADVPLAVGRGLRVLVDVDGRDSVQKTRGVPADREAAIDDAAEGLPFREGLADVARPEVLLDQLDGPARGFKIAERPGDLLAGRRLGGRLEEKDRVHGRIVYHRIRWRN